MKKNILGVLLILTLSFVLVGCGTKFTKKEGIEGYNGIYKKGKVKFYLVAIDKDKLEYCRVNKHGDRLCGTLDYENGKVLNESDEVEVKLNNNKLVIDTTNDFKGTYNKTKDLTEEDFYSLTYGLNKYYDNKYNGKYINGNDTLYMYQPTKKHIKFMLETEEEVVDCEAEIKEDAIVCEIIDTEYSIKLGENDLTYTVKSEENEKNIKFTKEGTLTKKEIINTFDPFYSLEEG